MTQDQNTSTKWFIPAASITGLILVILYALGMIGGGDKVEPGNTETVTEALPADAQTLTVGKHSADNILAWPGSVRSRTVAKIAPKLNARILEVLVNAGDTVKKGDMIARLDERIFRAATNEAGAALSAARANLTQAQADEKRTQDLYSQEAATRESYDAVVAHARAARAAVNQAASAVEQTRVNLGENSVRAPFSGIISERLQEPGDMGSPNEPIVILQKPDDLRFEAAIPSSCARRVQLGMTVAIRIDGIDKTMSGTLSEIAPQIDQQTRTQLLKADLNGNRDLQPGLFGWLDLSCSEQHQALFIPSSALLHYGQLEAVKIVDNNHVYTRHIRSGKQQGELIEILSGLKEGETIVINSGLKK